MTHKDFLSLVQKTCQTDGQQCSMLLNALCRLMSQAAVEQVPVTLSGLGTFVSHKHPEYIQDDPQSGRQTLFPPRITYRMQNEQENCDVIPLAQQLADHTKTSLDVSKRFISALISAIHKGLEMGDEVVVQGLGTFRIISSRQGDLSRVAYSPDESMREAVNAPFNCFEPYVIEAPITALSASLDVSTEDVTAEPAVAETGVENVSYEEHVEDAIPVPQDDAAPQEPIVPIVMPIESPTVEPVSEEVSLPQPEESSTSSDSVPEDRYYFDDDDDEEEEYYRRQRRRKLIFTLCALVLLLVGCIWWFVSNIQRIQNVPIVQVPAPVVTTQDTPKEPIAVAPEESEVLPEETSPVVTEEPAEVVPEEPTTVVPEEPTTVAAQEQPKVAAVEPTPAPTPSKSVESSSAPVKQAETKPDKTAAINSDGTTWKIQFLTSSTLYPDGDKHFGGLSPISHYQDGSYYKYTYSSAATKEELSAEMQKVRKVFKDAFYVHFDKNGKRIGFSFK